MMIKAENLNKYYTAGKNRLHVLKDVSLEIGRGQIIAVVGPSGAGKSTLLHILGGLDTPTTGRVLFEDEALGQLNDKALADIRNNSIGFVFQFYHLLAEFDCLENVMLAGLIGRRHSDRGGVRNKAEELLKSVGLGKRLGHFPSQLSGGEQQRVAVARSLINEPKLLLCDEPTGNLDSENGKQICELLSSLNKEKAMAVVLVTHNLDMAAIASKVYNIKDGVLR